MNKENCKSSYRYPIWLLITGLLGGFSGWCIYGFIANSWPYLYLLALTMFSTLFTLNGDNIVESIVLIIILGLIALSLGASETIISKLGMGAVPSFFGALATSKISFALAKEGVFGNERFT